MREKTDQQKTKKKNTGKKYIQIRFATETRMRLKGREGTSQIKTRKVKDAEKKTS